MNNIKVIAVDNCVNFYPKNLLRDVFEFRYNITQRLQWSQGLTLQKTPMTNRYSETDDQDKPGTVYFAKLDQNDNIVGVIRVSQSADETGRPISMISQTFNDLVDPSRSVPAAPDIWETSRILMDQESFPTPDSRRPLVDELIASTFFYAHQNKIKALFCFMAEGLWESTYKRIGLEVEKLGPTKLIKDKREYSVYAGIMKINDQIIERISHSTGLDSSILDFGQPPSPARFNNQPTPLSL